MPFRLLSRLTHTQAVFLMIAVTLMWSIAGVVTRQLESAARFEVTFWRSAFTALFAVGRVAGWCAHIFEQEKGGRIIRPQSSYVGPRPEA